MCNLRSCCCVVSLEVGAQIISICSLVLALAEAAFCMWSAVVIPLSEIRVITVYVALAVVALFEAFCAGLLIYGVFRKRPSFAIPWLVLAWVKAVVSLVVAILSTTLLVVHSHQPPSQGLEQESNNATITNQPVLEDTTFPMAEVIALTVTCYLQTLLLIYFAIVVNSRRKQIEDDDYSYYAPVRSDSIVRNVFVPITQPLPS